MICAMIIKAIRFRTRSSVNRLISHLKNGTDNDTVAFLTGTVADIIDMHLDALAKRSTYSIRHWIVSPHDATTREQMREVVTMIAEEFDFDPTRAVIVEHTKTRATADAHNVHWHVLVGEVDPVTHRALRCSFDRILHELVARWSEFKFGHRFVHGVHTTSVIAGLRKRGAFDAARSVEDQHRGKELPSREAFTHAQHQAGKRAGADLPTVRQAVKNAMARATTREELEATFAASSLLLAAGDKRDTWIVTSLDGAFIGSLARLSGIKKTEIDKIMSGASDESANDKSDNRTSNSSRSASYSQPVAAAKRTANTRPRSSCSDTGQNSGSAGKRIEPDRAPASETGLPQALALCPVGWFAGLERNKDKLSLLLGKANMLAMSSEERIVANLWEMEEQARFDFNRTVPVFAYSEKTTRLRTEVAAIEKSVAKKWHTLFVAEQRLGKARRPRWWHYLLGIAFVLKRQQRQLGSAVQQASDELRNYNSDLEKVKSKLVRQEVHDKEQHSALVQDIAKRKEAAGPVLNQVAAANEIIRQHPPMALSGLDFILAQARDRVRDQRRLKDKKVENDLDIGRFGYGR
ncbi:relaxase/mobilization nuclease domain-containing protein [Agrobacterium sp. 22-3674b3]